MSGTEIPARFLDAWERAKHSTARQVERRIVLEEALVEAYVARIVELEDEAARLRELAVTHERVLGHLRRERPLK